MTGATADDKGQITKNGKAIGVRRKGKNYVGFPTGNRIINVRVDEWAEYGFNPMPTFKQIPWHKEMKDDELILTTYKINVHKQSRTAAVKWLAEIMHSNPVWMNTVTGKKTRREDRRSGAGRKPGRLSRHQGLCVRGHSSQGRGHSDRVRPLGLRASGSAHALAFAARRAARGALQDDADLNNVWWEDKGVHPNNIIPVVADPIGGSQGWFDTVVKVTKAGPSDKYGDSVGYWEKHVRRFQGDHALRLHRRPAPQDASGNGILGRPVEHQTQIPFGALIAFGTMGRPGLAFNQRQAGKELEREGYDQRDLDRFGPCRPNAGSNAGARHVLWLARRRIH